MLKKIAIFFFLGTFLFQAVIFNVFLYACTLLVKFEEKAGDAQWIEFSEQQYSKLKLNESEFSYNNNLYDIITSKTEGGSIKLLCKIDLKEKDLLEKLIEGFKHSKAKKNISFLCLGDLIDPYELIAYLNSKFDSRNNFLITSVLEKSIDRTVPPPKN